MLALAAIVVALRAAGTSVGWGFQLQEPVFLLAICALLVAFAQNLFGAFEIAVDVSRLGGIGSRRPGRHAQLLRRAARGSARHAVLGAVPRHRGRLRVREPRARDRGDLPLDRARARDAVRARRGLARDRAPDPALRRVDGRSARGARLRAAAHRDLAALDPRPGAGPDAVTPALALLLAIAASTWALGLAQRRGRAVSGLAIAAVLLAVAAPGIVTIRPHRACGRGGRGFRDAARAGVLGRSRARKPRRRAPGVRLLHRRLVPHLQGERSACSPTRRVGSELERLGYDVYRADWTRRDAAIRRALAALGKAGVPAYAVYTPAAPDRPHLLPELLSADGLIDALREGRAVAEPGLSDAAHAALRRGPRWSRNSEGGCMFPAHVPSVAAAALLCAALAVPAGALEAGDTAPEFSAPGPHGRNRLARGLSRQGRLPRLLGLVVRAVRAGAARTRAAAPGVPARRLPGGGRQRRPRSRRSRRSSCSKRPVGYPSATDPHGAVPAVRRRDDADLVPDRPRWHRAPRAARLPRERHRAAARADPAARGEEAARRRR